MEKRQQYIEDRSDFFIMGYRKLINALFVLLLIIILLLGYIIYQHLTRPLPTYFATTIDGRLIEMKPLGESSGN